MTLISSNQPHLQNRHFWQTGRISTSLQRWSAAGLVFLLLGCTSPVPAATPVATSGPSAGPTVIAPPTVGVMPLPTTGVPGTSTPPLPVDQHYYRGNPNAKVVIEEWTDLQ